jgi:hypothetical protein
MDENIAAPVAEIFKTFTPAQRKTLLEIRDLVLGIADHPAVGEIEESLKWGEPAYRPRRARSGTTVRLGVSPKSPDACAIFVNCKTSLLATYRDLYPYDFGFEGDRALIVPTSAPLPVEALTHCLTLALTYHSMQRTR